MEYCRISEFSKLFQIQLCLILRLSFRDVSPVKGKGGGESLVFEAPDTFGENVV